MQKIKMTFDTDVVVVVMEKCFYERPSLQRIYLWSWYIKPDYFWSVLTTFEAHNAFEGVKRHWHLMESHSQVSHNHWQTR